LCQQRHLSRRRRSSSATRWPRTGGGLSARSSTRRRRSQSAIGMTIASSAATKIQRRSVAVAAVEWGRAKRGGLLERHIRVAPSFAAWGNRGELVTAAGVGHPREGCGFQLAVGGPPRLRRTKGGSLTSGPWWFTRLRWAERSPTPGRSA
jgi:hypothetical protein